MEKVINLTRTEIAFLCQQMAGYLREFRAIQKNVSARHSPLYNKLIELITNNPEFEGEVQLTQSQLLYLVRVLKQRFIYYSKNLIVKPDILLYQLDKKLADVLNLPKGGIEEIMDNLS